MTLQAGDIRFARSASMSDTDNGGGPPSSQLVPDGASNAMGLPDISEDDTVGGKVVVVQVHGVLRNTDTDALLGANVIVAEPPDDPNVCITLVKSPSTFSKRPDIVKIIEASSIPGPEFVGFLLENHVVGQRSVQIGQRPGAETPSVNTTLVLISDEGLSTQKLQYIRVRRVTVIQTTFTESTGTGYTDYPIQVATCEVFSPLAFDFAGSAANRFYTKQAGKTKTRRVTVTDAGTFYSASKTTVETDPLSRDVQLSTVYAQIVPNTKTETPLLNQSPGGLRTLTLTDSQGSFEVSAASHTQRVGITEANQGYVYTFKLTPPPAPNSVTINYMALATWYTVVDDGFGALGGGPGGGTVDYNTGDCAVTFDAVPDYNTFVLVTHADTAGYVNNAPSGAVNLTVRKPEFALSFAPGSDIDGSTITWVSNGVTYTATSDAAGALTGAATGTMVSASGSAYLRTSYMPEPGTNFTIAHASRPTTVKTFAGVSVDAGGFATLALDDVPLAGTVDVRWVTARKVSKSSGSDMTATSSSKSSTLLQDGVSVLSTADGYNPYKATVRYSRDKAVYSERTDSTTTDTQVVTHSATDDGVGGFSSALLGSVNYAGKSVNIRLVSQGGSVSGYKSDHEKASSFATYGAILSVSG